MFNYLHILRVTNSNNTYYTYYIKQQNIIVTVTNFNITTRRTNRATEWNKNTQTGKEKEQSLQEFIKFMSITAFHNVNLNLLFNRMSWTNNDRVKLIRF